MELTEHKPADVIETRETPLWFFANHPEPQACLDKNRDCEVGIDDWWQFVYENKHDEWREIGLDVPTEAMQFSGFWSQGDGASFYECAIDWEKFWPQLTGKYPLLAQFKAHLPQPELHHSGRYSHEYSVSISLDDPYGYAETEVVDAAIRQRFQRMPDYTMSVYRDHYEIWDSLAGRYQDRFAYELSQLEDELRDLLRDKMRDLYAALEEEYDYLTSDDLLREMFTDERYLFEADGTIHYV